MGTRRDPVQQWDVLVAQLAAARQRQGCSQRGLGARLGMAEIVVGKWEQQADCPSLSAFVCWAGALGLTPVIVRANGAVPSVTVIPRNQELLERFIARRIGLTLRQAREARGRTQEELGETLGVSEWTVRMWETARRDPRVPHLLAWANTLGCHVKLAK